MRSSTLLLALAATLLLLGCHPGGGGGGSAQAAKPEPSGLLAPDDRGFQEAYNHTPRVHADVVAGKWEQALDELTFVDREVTSIERAEDVSPRLKSRIGLVRPVIRRLATQIRHHDQASVHTARALVGAFAAVTNDPAVRTWMQDKSPRQVYP